MKIESSKMRSTAIACALGWAFAASAAPTTCPVTYSYVGYVTSTEGQIYAGIPLGAEVAGTYTFDIGNVLANGNSASNVSFGTAGSSTTNWQVGNSAGSGVPAPMPTGMVFSMMAQVAGFTYSTGTPASNYVFVTSLYSNSEKPNSFLAREQQFSGPVLRASLLRISNDDGTAAFGPHGLPQFTSTSKAVGGFYTGLGSLGSLEIVAFKIASLTVVSAPGHCVP